jgi:hypothetical protein
MTRFKAASIHFLISLLLALVVISLIVFGWYKLPYFWALGGPMLLALIVGVDIILGPLMTLYLFNPAKSRRELTLDLGFIALIQAAALIYGVYTAHASRVVYAVYTGNGFALVKASDILDTPLQPKPASSQYARLPMFGPLFVGLKQPDDPVGRTNFSFYMAMGGAHFIPAYYTPLDEKTRELKENGMSRNKLVKGNPELLKEVDSLLAVKGMDWSEAAVFPLYLGQAYYTVVCDTSSGNILRVIDKSPYGFKEEINRSSRQ